jgi:hypothetical protein
MSEAPATPLGSIRVSRARFQLILAFALFAAFHFLPWSTAPGPVGWRIWSAVLRVPRNWDNISGLLPTFGFLSAALLLVASPFLAGVFEESRLVRNLVFVASILATISLTGFILWTSIDMGEFHGGSGMICLMLAQVLHLAGMAMVKRRPPPALPG